MCGDRWHGTGNRIDEFFIDGWGKIKAAILDVSNPKLCKFNQNKAPYL